MLPRSDNQRDVIRALTMQRSKSNNFVRMTVESLQFRPIRRTMPANKIYVESYNM